MKKNILTKLGGLFLGLTMGLGVAVGVTAGHEVKEVKADSNSFDFSSTYDSKNSVAATKLIWSNSVVTITQEKGDGNDAIGNYTTAPRWYTKHKISFTPASGVTITEMAFTNTKNSVAGSWTVGSCSSQTWTGSLSGETMVFLPNAQCRPTAIAITYSSGGTPTTNYTVTFDVQGHGTAPQAATVASGDTVTKPADPSETGYTFGGWYKETGCTNAWVFETDTVSKDTTIYAKWTENGGGGGGTTVDGYYEKVTSALEDWSGQYLIVYEAGSRAFDGSLTTLDAQNNYFSVEISDNKIAATDETESKYFTIAKDDIYWTIQSASGYYIGHTGDKNSLSASQTLSDTQRNSIAYNDGVFTIKGSKGAGSKTLTYNTAADQNRFRYMGTTLIQLYKKAEGQQETIDLTDIGLEATSQVIVGSTVDLAPIKTPANANNKTTLTWESLNPAVATVSNGKVTGVTVGTAQIRVNATDIGKSAVCTVTVNPVPPVPVTHTIADCYSVSTGTNVKFNGVYMGTYGNNPYQGIFFADGQYGIIIYKTSSVPESWEVGKTVIAVTGKTAFYNGLVQVTDASFEATSATVADPVPYTFLGTETTGNALSRKSSISGTVTSVTGQTNNAFVSGTDGKVTVDLGDGKTAMIFIKKGVHSAQELADYTNKFIVGAYVVVTGFLNYYDNSTTFQGTYKPGSFQIIVPTIVSTKVYDADAFAADFLNDTDAICSIEKDDHGTELSAVWADIGAKFTALNDTEKAKVVAADAAAQTDLGKAVARYDYLVAKYSLTNFIDGRTPSPARVTGYINNQNDNTATIIIAVVSVLSLTTLCALIVIKRRKSIEK